MGQGAREKAGVFPTSTYVVFVLSGSRTRLGTSGGLAMSFLAWAQVVGEQKKSPRGSLQK